MAAIRIKTFWIILILAVFWAVVWYLNYSFHFNGFFWSDAHDYNQIARNIYEGNGFSTSVLRPISFLNFQTLPHPEITRPPLYPYLLACFYWLFSPNDFSVALLNGLFYVLLIPLTYIFARELSNDGFLALIAAACVGLSEVFLKMSIVGSSDILYTSLIVFFFYFYIRYPEKTFLIGFLAGLSLITRLNTVFLILAVVLVDYNPLKLNKGNWKHLGFFITGLLSVILPYMARNYMVLGSVVASSINSPILFTKSYPGFSLWTQINEISLWKFIVDHPNELYQKLTNSFFHLLADFRYFFGYVILLIMISGVFVPLKDVVHKRLRKIIIFTALIQTVVIISTVSPEARYYMFLTPQLIVLSLIFLRSVNIKYFSHIAYVFIVLLTIFSSLYFWQERKKFNQYEEMGNLVKSVTDKDAVIASDIAWEISWYADRRTVWLPYDVETMNKISKAIPIDYVFLSINLSQPLASYKDKIWQRLFFNAGSFSIPGFRVTNVFYYGSTPIGILYKIEKKFKNQEPS